jgi:hypothetical protein
MTTTTTPKALKEDIHPGNNRKDHDVSNCYQSMAEASNLQWTDDFFDNNDDNEGIVAVFDFDYDQIIRYNTKTVPMNFFISFTFLWFSLWWIIFSTSYNETGYHRPHVPGYFYGIIGALYIIFGYVQMIQVKWAAKANHIAITRDGILYVIDKHKSCLGYTVCDKGKHTKSIPFDKV